ncbi:MAG: hypothetical protein AAF203_07460, partial [Pseudomonadota bacterium]
DSRPMPEGACTEDHGALIEEFMREEFDRMKGITVPKDDRFGSTHAFRNQTPSTNGDTLYRMDTYGKSAEGTYIEPIDENDHPFGTSYRCWSDVIVTAGCDVVWAETAFMDTEILEIDAERGFERETGKAIEDLEPGEFAAVGVKTRVPKVYGMTCNRKRPDLEMM